MIIMLTGYKRSGKDTVGSIMREYLENKGWKVKTLKFADYLYQTISELLQISKDTLENIKDKTINKTDLTIRDLMKAIALYKRKDDELFFVKDIIKKINLFLFVKERTYYLNKTAVIITDTRFIKEHETLKKEFKDVYLIKVVRKGLEPDDVETEVELMMPYYVIENNETIDELKDVVIKVLNKIIKE